MIIIEHIHLEYIQLLNTHLEHKYCIHIFRTHIIIAHIYLEYYRVIALILRNIVPSSISHYTSLRVQYDILWGTIFLNISAITLL
jgi:hypothetical protein